MARTTVKLYGERNTAVEVVAKLLRGNFDVALMPGMAGELDPQLGVKMKAMMGDRPLSPRDTVTIREAFIDRMFLSEMDKTLGWISGAPLIPVVERRTEPLHLVVVVRHVYSWLVAMHRRPQNALTETPKDIADFVAAPWVTLRRDNAAPAFASPVDLWVQKMRSYVALHQVAEKKGFGFTVVRYEDLLRDQMAVVVRLSESLTRTAHEFSAVPTDGHVLGDGKSLSPEVRDYVNKRVPQSLLARFHYAVAE